MRSELVTVVVPIYNVEKYLDECMLSIINQTYKNIEIIAIDDGSTDNSLEIIKKYKAKDKRIKLIFWGNKGVGNCRNEGIKLANGKYIFFIDSDDYIHINTLEVLVKNMEKHNDEIIVYNGIAFDDYDNVANFYKRKYFNISSEIYGKRLVGTEFFKHGIDCVQPCIKIYNKEFLRENNILFPEGTYGEDIEFWYKCCKLSKSIRYIDFVGYYRRYRPNSIMTGGNIRNISDRIENFEALNNIVLSIEEHHRNVFIQSFGSYVLGLYYEMLKRNKGDFKELYKLFRDNNGMEFIKLTYLKPKSRVKKYICIIYSTFRNLLDI